jgi:hypothetical protein
MTPEELSRTMEFIAASQARLAAAQEQDHQDRIEFQDWSKGVTSQVLRLQKEQSELSDIQSQRMDRLDRFYGESLKRTDEFQKQLLHLLHRILDKLDVVLDRLPAAPAT